MVTIKGAKVCLAAVVLKHDSVWLTDARPEMAEALHETRLVRFVVEGCGVRVEKRCEPAWW